MRLLIVIVLP